MLLALTTRQTGYKDRFERPGIQMTSPLLIGMIVEVSRMTAYRTLIGFITIN
jgi:hypothetical protein